MARRYLVVFAMALGMTSMACVGPKPLYPGKTRPLEEVGVVKLVTNGAITSIAGRELEGRAYALLPARYPVEFRVIVRAEEFFRVYKGTNQRVAATCTTTLDVEAGHEYQLSRTKPIRGLRQTGEKQSADGSRSVRFDRHVYVIDAVSGQQIAEPTEADCVWPNIQFGM